MGVLGYERVSTAGQADSGLGLDAQRSAIEAEAKRRGWEVAGFETDEGVSATAARRPALDRALARLSAGEADALVVAKLDRLARSTLGFAEVLATAQREGWALVALDLGVDMTTPSGRLVASVMAAVASWEVDVIRARTTDALAEAKARGTVLGRPRLIDPALVDRISGARPGTRNPLDRAVLGDGGRARARGRGAVVSVDRLPCPRQPRPGRGGGVSAYSAAESLVSGSAGRSAMSASRNVCLRRFPFRVGETVHSTVKETLSKLSGPAERTNDASSPGPISATWRMFWRGMRLLPVRIWKLPLLSSGASETRNADPSPTLDSAPHASRRGSPFPKSASVYRCTVVVTTQSGSGRSRNRNHKVTPVATAVETVADATITDSSSWMDTSSTVGPATDRTRVG